MLYSRPRPELEAELKGWRLAKEGSLCLFPAETEINAGVIILLTKKKELYRIVAMYMIVYNTIEYKKPAGEIFLCELSVHTLAGFLFFKRTQL